MARTKRHREVLSTPQITRFPGRDSGNLLYPLPADYEELTEEGRRLARLNACMLQQTPEDMVVAWDFFRRTYLQTTEPGFFYGADLTESPPMHYEIIHALASAPRNIRVCPRGFGKSTLADEVILLLALSRPFFPTTICLATDSLVEERFEIYHTQFTQNEFILNDWGNMKPSKGEGKWNQHMMHLRNGSRLRGFGVEGKKRGTKPRPALLVLDDPEYDPKESTDTEKLRRDFNNLLSRVLLNMGAKGMCMLWLGTMISKQSSLWFWARAEEPRAQLWNRRIYQVFNSEGRPTWDDYMGQEEIDEKIQEIGYEAFATEYLNNPGEGTEATFELDPVYHLYYLDGEAGGVPLESQATVSYNVQDKEGNKVQKTEAFGSKVSKMFRCMMMDYAPTVSATSDFSAIVVVGFEKPYDVMWVLDCWQGKVKEDRLVEVLYRMGTKWLPRVVGIESVSMQRRVYELGKSLIESRQQDGGWTPKVMPIQYKRAQGSKQDRISGMRWRFGTNRIKFWGDMAVSDKNWSQLLYQVTEFRGDAIDGNLQHDDLVDALSMYQEIVRTHGAKNTEKVDRRSTHPLDMLRDNRIIDEVTGLQPILGVSGSEIPADMVKQHYFELGLHGQDDERSLAQDFMLGDAESLEELEELHKGLWNAAGTKREGR